MTEEPRRLVAVDAGGTSTRAVVIDASGRCLGYAVAGSGNPTASGPAVAAASVVESVRAAMERSSTSSPQVDLVTLSMAGAGSSPVATEVGGRLTDAGLTVPLVFESDLLATYFSGTPRPDGYALIAGTGAGAIRVEHGRQAAVADGLGWLLGDEGSGFWIGQQVVRAALADLDGRGPATALTPLVLARLGAPTPSYDGDRAAILAVVQAVYGGPPLRLAEQARAVFEADGDAVADRILDDAATALERTLAAVRSPEVSGPVVLGGGVLGHSRRLTDRLARALRTDELHVVPDGALGACVLTLRHARTHVDEAVLERLATSLTEVRWLPRLDSNQQPSG